MDMQCKRESDHELASPMKFAAKKGGCRHRKAETMSRAEFRMLPVARCLKCQTALGRVCPECRRVY